MKYPDYFSEEDINEFEKEYNAIIDHDREKTSLFNDQNLYNPLDNFLNFSE
jgi:hypothetical protein